MILLKYKIYEVEKVWTDAPYTEGHYIKVNSAGLRWIRGSVTGIYFITKETKLVAF